MTPWTEPTPYEPQMPVTWAGPGNFLTTDADSISAALRRVQAEFAEALQELEIARTEVANLRGVQAELEAVLADNQELTGENAELVDRSLALKAELRAARRRIAALERLPKTDDEIYAWCADHGLTPGAGLGRVFAALRDDLNPEGEPPA